MSITCKLFSSLLVFPNTNVTCSFDYNYKAKKNEMAY